MSNQLLLEKNATPTLTPAVQVSTRKRIIMAAMRLFVNQGYHGTSTQDIATAVQIRKSSLFHHFKNKTEIGIAAINELLKICEENVFIYAGSKVEDNKRAWQFLEALCWFQLQYDFSTLVTFIGTELVYPNSEFNKPIEDYLKKWQENLLIVLGSLHSREQAMFIAQATLNYMHGVGVMQRILPGPEYVQQFRSQLITLWKL